MAKIRVHELAKELNIPSKEMVVTLQNLGLDVKNHMSTVEDSQASWVRKKLTEPPVREDVQKKPDAAPRQTVTPAPKTPEPPPRPGTKPPATDRSMPDRRVSREPIQRTDDGKKQPSTGAAQNQRGKSEQKPAPQPNREAQRERGPAAPGVGTQAPAERRPAPGTRPQTPSGRRPGPGIKPMSSSERQSASGARTENRPRPQTAPPRSPDHRPHQPGTAPQRRPEGQIPGRNNALRPDAGTRPAPRPSAGQSQAPNRPAQQDKQNRVSPSGKPGPEGKSRPAGAKNFAQNKGGQMPKRDYSRPQRKGKHKRKKEDTLMQTPEMITIGPSIQVRELAEVMGKTPAEIVKKLMELGTMATINQEIDFDTAEIVASLFGVAVEAEISAEKQILEEIVDDEKTLVPRSPVVTVMGHVDHGKTSLLDKIRKADVVSGEAGGITQHIGAYQVNINGNRITFIDTPGHAAFTAMRARGANLTDIVILVVAADDGVMPQTIEAINHIKAANVPFVVALNKMDKPDINPDRVMQQLTEYNIVPEEWGGDTMFIPVSAKTGFGIEDLLERVLLIAELHDLRANPDRFAEGVVIEGELDKGKGAVATVLVQKGTLHIGDFIVCGFNWCKVRAMTDYRGRKVEAAYPSMPIEITGWSDVPEAGEKVQACDEKIAKDLANLRLNEKKIEEQKQSSRISLDDFFKQMQDAAVKELNLIIKGDVQGSVEALASSLLRLNTGEVKVNVIHSAVGAISETDVMLASASNAIIIGFNVRPDVNARKHAEEENIDVRLYRVIYEAIENVKKAMEGLLEPEYKEKYLGRAEVRATFKVPNVGIIAGSYVIDGKIQRNTNMRVLRDGVIVYDGKLESLKRFKDDVKEVVSNYECGIGIQDFNDIREGDIIEAFIMEEIKRTLD
ncbi:MAG: translation initiation factor IF-2 [Syntrophomonadaceae bacterium]|nr:translation initiation factor IF-2 [Syntrophomonadaceae bacterium]